MKQIRVKLENCYGIGQLECEFDFSKSPVHAIYAPNGFMKSSFARTLRDLAEGQASSDRLFPERPTLREVVEDSGAELAGEQVLVIEPYGETVSAPLISHLAPTLRTASSPSAY